MRPQWGSNAVILGPCGGACVARVNTQRKRHHESAGQWICWRRTQLECQSTKRLQLHGLSVTASTRIVNASIVPCDIKQRAKEHDNESRDPSCCLLGDGRFNRWGDNGNS